MVSRPELRDITPKKFRTSAVVSYVRFYISAGMSVRDCLVNETLRHFDFLVVFFFSPFLSSCAIRRFLSRTYTRFVFFYFFIPTRSGPKVHLWNRLVQNYLLDVRNVRNTIRIISFQPSLSKQVG